METNTEGKVNFWATPASDTHVNPTPEIALKEVLSLIDLPVLDFGCGFGRLSGHFPPESYLGVDINHARVQKARTLNPRHNFLYIFDSSWIPGLGTFETTVVDNVLHHVPDDEIFKVTQHLSLVSRSIVQAEHIGTPRTGHHTSHTRSLNEYEKIFSICGFGLETKIEVFNDRRGINFSVIRWEKKSDLSTAH